MTSEIHDNLLRNTIDSSIDLIQVFRAVRNNRNEIVDFVWILNNRAAEEIYGDVIGKSLLTLNPGVIKEGIFETFKRVVETGIPDQSVHHYVHEQFNGWFHQSAVKQGDGVSTTTRDITDLRAKEEQLKAYERQSHRHNVELALKAVEEERQRIAESLHNGVGQLLYAIKLSLTNIGQYQGTPQYAQMLQQTERIIGDAIEETRTISHQLMPVYLQQFGLEQSLYEVCKPFQPNVKFSIHINGKTEKLDKHISIIVFRIAQELITNCVKHSGCSFCRVHLETSEQRVKLKVRDNGNGKLGEDFSTKGIGLSSTISKVSLLNGTVNINSVPDVGTEIDVCLPLGAFNPIGQQ